VRIDRPILITHLIKGIPRKIEINPHKNEGNPQNNEERPKMANF
jgi:hypothetical protein